jgi:hypothetical protein
MIFFRILSEAVELHFAEMKRKSSHVITVYLVHNIIVPSASTFPNMSPSTMFEPTVCVHIFLVSLCTLHIAYICPVTSSV